MMFCQKAVNHMMSRMEKRLIELMGQEAYAEFAKEIAKEAFAIEVDNMDDGKFKDFCIENFGEITSD